MKIKQILRHLLSGEDFSDHTSGPEDGHGPLHDKGCAFCGAWREALNVLGSALTYNEFDRGEPVWIEGGIPGRVMGTDVTVRVEVQNGERGPWVVGLFSPLALTPRAQIALEHTWWSDSGNAVWQRHEASKKMLLVRDEDGQPTAVGGMLNRAQEWPYSFETVEKRWGPLTQVDKP